LELVSGPGPYAAVKPVGPYSGYYYRGLIGFVQLVAATTAGTRIRDLGITFTSPGCGTFNGAISAERTTDLDGRTFVPLYWEPLTEGACVIRAEVSEMPTVAASIDVVVSAVNAPSPELPTPGLPPSR
jgi:hypothetical protein